MTRYVAAARSTRPLEFEILDHAAVAVQQDERRSRPALDVMHSGATHGQEPACRWIVPLRLPRQPMVHIGGERQGRECTADDRPRQGASRQRSRPHRRAGIGTGKAAESGGHMAIRSGLHGSGQSGRLRRISTRRVVPGSPDRGRPGPTWLPDPLEPLRRPPSYTTPRGTMDPCLNIELGTHP